MVVLILCNKYAGHGMAASMFHMTLYHALSKKGIPHEIVYSHEEVGIIRSDKVRGLMQSNANLWTLVVVMGGDGTVNETVNAMVAANIQHLPLLVVPTGFTNSLASTLGIKTADLAIDMAVSKAPTTQVRLPLWKMQEGNTRKRSVLFHSAFNTGYHAAMTYQASRFRDWMEGFDFLPPLYWPQLPGFLHSLAYEDPRHVQLRYETLDGVMVDVDQKDCSYFHATQLHTYRLRSLVSPKATIDANNPHMHITMAPGLNPYEMIRFNRSIRLGKHVEFPGTKYFPARKFSLKVFPPEADSGMGGGAASMDGIPIYPVEGLDEIHIEPSTESIITLAPASK
eukprot:PhF_6_TR15441/c0_g1_i1/m.23961